MYLFTSISRTGSPALEVGDDEGLYMQENTHTKMRTALLVQDQISMMRMITADSDRTIHATCIEIEGISRMQGEGTMGADWLKTLDEVGIMLIRGHNTATNGVFYSSYPSQALPIQPRNC